MGDGGGRSRLVAAPAAARRPCRPAAPAPAPPPSPLASAVAAAALAALPPAARSAFAPGEVAFPEVGGASGVPPAAGGRDGGGGGGRTATQPHPPPPPLFAVHRMAFHRARLAGLLYGSTPRLAAELAATVPLRGGLAAGAPAGPPFFLRPPAAVLAADPAAAVVPPMLPSSASAFQPLSWGLPGEDEATVDLEVVVAGGSGLHLARAARLSVRFGGPQSAASASALLFPAVIVAAPPEPDPALTYAAAAAAAAPAPSWRARLGARLRAAAGRTAAAVSGEGTAGGRLLLRVSGVPRAVLTAEPGAAAASLTLYSLFQPGGVGVAVTLLAGPEAAPATAVSAAAAAARRVRWWVFWRRGGGGGGRGRGRGGGGGGRCVGRRPPARPCERQNVRAGGR